jgi:hypothetical protein
MIIIVVMEPEAMKNNYIAACTENSCWLHLNTGTLLDYACMAFAQPNALYRHPMPKLTKRVIP